MSGRRFILIAFALVLFGVGVPLSTSAQPASDDENLQVVLQAFRTARREGYHFRSKSLTTNTYTKADGSTLFYYFALDQEGDV
ncbi:MAG: hypothetical protein GC204_06640, partial [Chloroflexi bacterium]|nr:hypothetical protein [Chloroflexota bacterium]